MNELTDPGWHALASDRVCGQLGGDPQVGLTSEEAARRLAGHGPNVLPESARRTLADEPLLTLAMLRRMAFMVGSSLAATFGRRSWQLGAVG